MKNLYRNYLIISICLFNITVIAQSQAPSKVVTADEWNARKKDGTVTPEMTLWDANLLPLINTQPYQPAHHESNIRREKSQNICTCFQPIDTCQSDTDRKIAV